MSKMFVMDRTSKNVAAIAAMLCLNYGNGKLTRNNSLSLINIASTIERLIQTSQEMDKIADEQRRLKASKRYQAGSVREAFLLGRWSRLMIEANLHAKLLACPVETNDIESHSTLWLRIPFQRTDGQGSGDGCWPLYERTIFKPKNGIEKGKPPIEKVSPL